VAKNARKSARTAQPKNRFDWDEYARRVSESVVAAEQHLQIPPGTISSILKEPDFIATVKAYAVVEPLLNDLIATWPPKNFVFGSLASPPQENDSFRNFVTGLAMSGNTGKLKLAEGLGLLQNDDVLFIRALATVRNRYAHNVKNIHSSLAEMLTEEQRSNQKIAAHLTGLQHTLPLGSVSHGDTNLILKLLMYHRLADYLARALSTLRPPPPPGEGVLGLWKPIPSIP
jgi:hypothetical protein